ncbi:hypothetical protein FNV43_RR25972 [Rhamnella rubrinervis]|uniref:RNA-binding protein 48 n=1 Tax=Rhamnella rubrinervis TaxID=2594499 RepID=A0A8K0DU44_9ROSA|nr:hypothetical protein FNV43_RR25972 [Rhamnella rubrinervis]
MGKQPVRMKAVVYALSPFQQKVMSGLFNDIPGKIHHKVSENWISAVLLVAPLVGTYTYVQNYLEKEKLAHRKTMPRYKDEPPAVRVYTVCDESRYLVVSNIPALGCGDELLKLFSSYGDVEECKPMDAEDCEAFTDVYWIKFRLVNNARFAKRKLDDYVFLGNRLKVSYAPYFESLTDTKEKLECRRNEVLARLNPGRSKGSTVRNAGALTEASLDAIPSQFGIHHQQMSPRQRGSGGLEVASWVNAPPITRVSSDKEYFPSQSMNQTVQLVREKLNKIQSSGQHLQEEPSSKKTRLDNRRRI